MVEINGHPLDESVWSRAWGDASRFTQSHLGLLLHVFFDGACGAAAGGFALFIEIPPDGLTKSVAALGAALGLAGAVSGFIMLWVGTFLFQRARAPYRQRGHARDQIRAGLRPLDIRVDTGATRTFLVQSQPPQFGGWLYIAVITITNREANPVSLSVDMMVRLGPRGDGSFSKSRLSASAVSPSALEGWIEEAGPLPEFSGIARLPLSLDIESKHSVTGYLVGLLPDWMIPREGANFGGKSEMLSVFAPDSDVLIFEDSVSDRRLRERWNAFDQQATEEKLNKAFPGRDASR